MKSTQSKIDEISISVYDSHYNGCCWELPCDSEWGEIPSLLNGLEKSDGTLRKDAKRRLEANILRSMKACGEYEKDHRVEYALQDAEGDIILEGIVRWR